MQLNGIPIDDTFAEAFGMVGTRLVVTADSFTWAYHAANSMTGFATSVIGCGVEAGIEREVQAQDTPDGRPGLAVLLFSVSKELLATQVETRVGQCVLTCPGTACFAGLEDGETIGLGSRLRYFGDGFQTSKVVGGRRYWRIPVMDGEFLCQDKVPIAPAVGGGNFLILAASRGQALAAAERSIAAMRGLPGVVMPFPGGVVRSGSKVGSKYKALMASTNDAYCPTLRGRPESKLPEAVEAVLEIVIDGLTADAISVAMRTGIQAACAPGPEGGVVAITAGNYGGQLGQFHFHLRELLP